MFQNHISNWKTVLKLAWPLIIANAFWNLQLTIDRIFLSHYSTEALGAAMAVMGVFWVPMALLQQTAAYAMTFVSQYAGAKQFEQIGPALWQAIYISLGGGLLILLLAPFSAWGFAWMDHDPNLQVLEVSYFNALLFSALPAAVLAAAGGYFSSVDKSSYVMWVNLVGLLSNVLFDSLLIFGLGPLPAMGVAGAGYATAIANVVAAAFSLYLVFSTPEQERFHLRRGWRIDFDLMRRYLRFGVPSGLQWALEGLAFTAFLIIIGRTQNGTAGLAASGIAVTLMMLSVLPSIGVAQAVSVLVGKHLGDKRPDLAEAYTWTGWQIVISYISLVSISFVFFPQFYLSWFFNPEDPILWQQVSIIVPYLLMAVALFTLFDSMNFIFSFALKGAGDTLFVTIIALILPWPLMVAPTWFTRHEANSVYLAWIAASFFIIVQALVFLGRFRRGKWKKMSVID